MTTSEHKEHRVTAIVRLWIIPILVFGSIFLLAHQVRNEPPSNGCEAVEVGMSGGAYCTSPLKGEAP